MDLLQVLAALDQHNRYLRARWDYISGVFQVELVDNDSLVVAARTIMDRDQQLLPWLTKELRLIESLKH